MAEPEVAGWNAEADTPPWMTEMPEPSFYAGAELAIAGALSTMPPFDRYHPAYALPYARRALEALDRWEPDDG